MTSGGTKGMTEFSEGIESVKDYYGRVLAKKSDLRTTACCTSGSFPSYLSPAASKLHPEVVERCYGCGVPIPEAVSGCTALDLGCGAGRDAFLLSSLVGAEGRVIGVDMTDEQLAVAERHIDYHREQFLLERSNVEFRKGYIEDLEAAGLGEESVDLVVSNCVFNLSPAKERLFQEIFRVLKPGGELYFSDVFCDRRLPASLVEDQVLLGECLAGALYTEDFRRILLKCGIADYRILKSDPIAVTDRSIREKLGGAQFSSITVRCFKLSLEDRCEDYGQAVSYRGTIPECPIAFRLDDHHLFEKDRVVPVCENTRAMLLDTRYGGHFELYGKGEVHYGLFSCELGETLEVEGSGVSGGCC